MDRHCGSHDIAHSFANVECCSRFLTPGACASLRDALLHAKEKESERCKLERQQQQLQEAVKAQARGISHYEFAAREAYKDFDRLRVKLEHIQQQNLNLRQAFGELEMRYERLENVYEERVRRSKV